MRELLFTLIQPINAVKYKTKMKFPRETSFLFYNAIFYFQYLIIAFVFTYYFGKLIYFCNIKPQNMIERPCGEYFVLADEPDYKSKEIEVQNGTYFGKEDIVRIDNGHHRA